jgi:hypothetical protein
MTRPTWWLRIAGPVLAVALTCGCTGAGSSPAATSSSSSAFAPPSGGFPPAGGSAPGGVSFSHIISCLKAHGVNLQGSGLSAIQRLNFSDPNVQKALKACVGARPQGSQGGG